MHKLLPMLGLVVVLSGVCLAGPLLEAVKAGNLAGVQRALQQHADANEAEPSSGQTALMLAASEGHAEAVKLLLAAGASTAARSRMGETAIFFAVRHGNAALVEALVAGGANVNERSPAEPVVRCANCEAGAPLPGDSMLTVAIVNAHFALADFLLSKGADPNLAGSRWQPLHALARVRNYEESQYPPPFIQEGDLDSLDLAKHLLAKDANPALTPSRPARDATLATKTMRNSKARHLSISRPRTAMCL